MIAVVTAREGLPAAGSLEAVLEADGVGLVAGGGAVEAAGLLSRSCQSICPPGREVELRALELGAGFGPARFAAALAPLVAGEGVVVLPGAPDGRDLAPRLAFELGWPLLAGALAVAPTGAVVVRMDGRQLATFRVKGSFVATLLPGARWVAPAQSAEPDARSGPHDGAPLTAAAAAGLRIVSLLATTPEAASADPEVLETTTPDAASMTLSEARRIVAAGGGVGGREHVALLEEVASRLGAAVGGTRVVTDAGWLDHDRQIGTTGATVTPRCYLAFGISGAAQHLAGLGAPGHVVAVNRDGSCPMMAMADLALVTDAPALVEALARRLAAAIPVPDASEALS